MTTMLLMLTLAAYPYPPTWNPNLDNDATCANKFRGRRFSCTVRTEAAPTVPFVVEVYTDRLPLDQRPGPSDFTIEGFGMTCTCNAKGSKSLVMRNHKSAFTCASEDVGGFAGSRGGHSDFRGSGTGAPFGGAWSAACDDHEY